MALSVTERNKAWNRVSDTIAAALPCADLQQRTALTLSRALQTATEYFQLGPRLRELRRLRRRARRALDAYRQAQQALYADIQAWQDADLAAVALEASGEGNAATPSSGAPRPRLPLCHTSAISTFLYAKFGYDGGADIVDALDSLVVSLAEHFIPQINARYAAADQLQRFADVRIFAATTYKQLRDALDEVYWRLDAACAQQRELQRGATLHAQRCQRNLRAKTTKLKVKTREDGK